MKMEENEMLKTINCASLVRSYIDWHICALSASEI